MKKNIFLSLLITLVVGFTACNNVDEPQKPDNGNGKFSVLYKENFGNAATASPWPSIADYTGFTKEGLGAAAVTYTAQGGLVSIRSNQTSKDYTGASGECNAMAAAGGASLIINDIATCGATNLLLSFGSIVVSDTLQVSYKINGTTEWKNIPYVKEKGGWGLVDSLKITLPAGTNTIKLKFDAAKTQYGTRVDDITLITKDATSAPVIDPDNTGGGNLTEISIADLRALNTDAAKTAKVTIPADKKIIGIVISDGQNGNTVQNNIQIVSENNAAGIMIRFSENQNHGFLLGDKVEIDVSGQSLEFYNKLLQVNGVPLANAKKVSGGVSVVPATATISQIISNMNGYESRLVKIDNVTITNTSTTYSGNATINDGASMTLYTRSQASFASTAIPVGIQNITAFVTRFNDTNQVSIRNLSDVVSSNPNAPVLTITSSNTASVDVSTAFSHTFTTQEANLTGATVITCANLPSWLTISGKTISGTAPSTAGTFTLNIVATNGATVANQTFTITVKTPAVAGANMLKNFSFEEYTDAVPTTWSMGVSPNNAPLEKITTGAQDGSIAIKIAGNADGRCDLKQAIPGIVPGKTYIVSFWYKDNTKTAGSSGIRLWSNFTKGGAFVAPGDLAATLQPSTTLEVVSAWTKYEVEVVAPVGVDGFNFEIRATKSNSGVIDNCSFSEKQ